MTEEQKLHCDGYYHECTKRGKVDEFDLRKDKKGFVLPKRTLCLDGIYPSGEEKPCRHCIEYKYLYRRLPQARNSRVRTYRLYNSVDGICIDGTR